MGRGGYLGIRGYRGLAVVDVATIGRSDSLLEQLSMVLIWWDIVKWGFNCNYIPIHFFGGVWYGIHRVIDNNVIWLLVWCIACKRMVM